MKVPTRATYGGTTGRVAGLRVGMDSYSPDEVEAYLQQGDVVAAVQAGWFGDEWVYRCIHNAAGGTLETIDVTVEPYQSGMDLGLDLTNNDGVAGINSISTLGFIHRDGRLLEGDIVRGVNGQKLFTCEAVVRCIKNARGSTLAISVVRPPPVHTWRDDALFLPAGKHHMIPFDVSTPGACLTFRWLAQAHDVAFSVVRLGSKSEGTSQRHQHGLYHQRTRKGSDHVLLSQPGCYLAAFDNTFSVFRSKQLQYLIRLVPLSAWETGRQLERLAQLEARCTQCKEHNRKLVAQISQHEARTAELEQQLAASRDAAEQARTAREQNKERWREAKMERDALLQQRKRESLEGIPHRTPGTDKATRIMMREHGIVPR